MRESFDRVSAYIRSEAQTWGKSFAFVLAFFILVTAITNALYGLFDFTLLPVFSNTLEDIRLFVHTLFDTFLYTPINSAISWVASLFFQVTISMSKPPVWYTDLVLISMILSRAEHAAMKMAEPIKDDVYVKRSFPERLIWGVVLFFYIPTEALLFPIKRFSPKRIYLSARILLDGVTWLGFWFLLHDLAVVHQYRDKGLEAVKSHRAFVLFVVLSLLSATAASLVFFLMNGYLHHYFLQSVAMSGAGGPAS